MYDSKIGVSIHVPLAEHDRKQRASCGLFLVSIHVPLAEHDVPPVGFVQTDESFNSRAPRGARPRNACFA